MNCPICSHGPYKDGHGYAHTPYCSHRCASAADALVTLTLTPDELTAIFSFFAMGVAESMTPLRPAELAAQGKLNAAMRWDCPEVI